MSFLAASAGASGAGKASPLVVPTNPLVSRVAGITNGSTPDFTVTSTINAQTAGNKNAIVTGYKIYRTSDNLVMKTVYGGTYTYNNTLVAGTQYYAKGYITDTVQNLEAYSVSSGNIVAMTKPANVASITASGYPGGVQFSWAAVNNGGDTGMVYTYALYRNGSLWASGSLGSSTSYSWSDNTTTNSYYLSLRPTNAYESSVSATTSSSVNPQAVYIPPTFGPYFACIEAETPIMVWVDGNKLYKKAKEITVGDKLVSYSFDELPESEFDYSIDTWSEKSLTPKTPESAEVVSVQELITKATMYLNGDINTRMSLDHSVFVKKNDTYSIVASGLIEVGDTVIKINPETMELSEISVENIEYIDEESKIYKIDCKPYDVFFAGHILTHNRKKFY